MKEIYKVQTPYQIRFGDPEYFDQFSSKRLSKEDLERLTVDCEPPASFETRLVLDTVKFPECPGILDTSKLPEMLTLSIYMAPSHMINEYLQGKRFRWKGQDQEDTCKDIGVDSASYLLQVDEESHVFQTEGDGYRGTYTEIGHRGQLSNRLTRDAIILDILLPERVDRKKARNIISRLFKRVHWVEITQEGE